MVVFTGIREMTKVDRMIRENVIFPKRMKQMWPFEQRTDIAKNYLPDRKFPIAQKMQAMTRTIFVQSSHRYVYLYFDLNLIIGIVWYDKHFAYSYEPSVI